MSTLWTSQDAARATGGQVTTPWTASGVSIDTRTIARGDLFVALKDQRDGHDFVAQALAAGAAAAVVSHVPEGVAPDAPLLIVDDTLAALTALGQAARERMTGKVAAVTGSVGKTGSKEMLRTALSAQGKTHAAEKSYNNHWGVPLTLARMPADTDFAVIEIGMNAPGEIAPLSRLARPHVGLITTVAAVHLEAFGSVEGIAREKASIVAGIAPGGTLIYNVDTSTAAIQAAAGRDAGLAVRGFGTAEGADYRLTSVHVSPVVTTASAQTPSGEVFFKLDQPGRHLAANALGVLAVVHELGADLAQGAMALGAWEAPEGRGARWIIDLGPAGIDGSVQLIDESYNANPAAMEAAFDVFALVSPKDGVGRVARGRRIALLADMLELGEAAESLHAGLADIPSLAAVDKIHCAGPLMRALHEALPTQKRGVWAETTAELAPQLKRLIDAGDVVMCKGSNGARAGVLVEAVKALGTARRMSHEGAE